VAQQPLLHRFAPALGAERRTNHVVACRLDARFGVSLQVAFKALVRYRKARRSTHVQDAPVPDGEQLAHHLAGTGLVVRFDVHHAGQQTVGLHRHQRHVRRQPCRAAVLQEWGEQDQAIDTAVTQRRDAHWRLVPVAQREDGRRLPGGRGGLHDATENFKEVEVRLFTKNVGDEAHCIAALGLERTRARIGQVPQPLRLGQHTLACLGRHAGRASATPVERGRRRHFGHACRARHVLHGRGVATAGCLRRCRWSRFRLRIGHRSAGTGGTPRARSGAL